MASGRHASIDPAQTSDISVSLVDSQNDRLGDLRHFDRRSGQVWRQGRHRRRFAVDEECLPFPADLCVPLDQLALVGMGRETVDRMNRACTAISSSNNLTRFAPSIIRRARLPAAA